MVLTPFELFESAVGQTITVPGAQGPEQWRVDSVKPLKQHALRTDQPFAALLSAPAGTSPQQGMRTAVFPGDASLDLFAVPLGATAEGVSYEVTFN